MADYTLSAKITGDATGFEKAFAKAQIGINNFSTKIKGFGSGIKDVGKMLMPISDAVSGLGIVTGKTAVEFLKLKEDTKTAFKVLLGGAEEAEQMLDSLYTFAKTTPFSYGTYLQAGKAMVAMGVSAENCIPYLDGITNAAIATSAGQEGINTLSGAIGRMSSKGKIQLEELNSFIQMGVPAVKILGNAYGVSEEQVYKMMQSGKLLASDALPKLIKGMNEGTDGVNGATAAYGGLANEMKGSLSGVLDSLKSKFRNMSTELWNAEDTFPALIETIKAFTKTLDVLPKVFKAVGDMAAPVLTEVSEKLKAFAQYVEKASPEKLEMVGSAILGLAAAGPILAIVGSGIKKIGDIISVLSFLASPIGLIIGVVAALAAGFVYLMTTNEGFRNKVIEVWGTVQKKIGSAIEAIKPILASLMAKAVEVFNKVSSFVGTAFENALPFITNAINKIVPIVKGLFSNLNAPVAGFATVFGLVAAKLAPHGKTIVDTIMAIGKSISDSGGILGFFKGGLSQIGGAMSALFSPATLIIGVIALLVAGFVTLMATNSEFRETIMGLVSSIGSSLAPIFTMLGEAIQNIASAVLPVLISVFNQLLPFIGQIITLILQVVAALAPMITQLIGAILPVITNIIQVIMNIVQSVMPILIAILNVVMAVIGALVPIITNILSVVISVISGIISAINPIISFIGLVISSIMAVITPIVTFILNIIATIIGIIGIIIGAITGIFATVFSIISDVFTNVSNFIASVITKVSTVISNLTSTVGNVFNGIYSTVADVMGKVGSFIGKIFDGIKSAWKGLTSFVSGVFDGIGKAVSSLVSTVKGFVNGVIGGINSAIGLINMIPGVSIGTIPYLLHGTDDWSGGFARMNEGGRGELTYLPNGTQVIPHDISVKYAKEAARSNVNSGGEIDYNRLINGIASALGRVTVEHISVLNGKTLAKELTPLINNRLGRQAYKAERA